MVEGDSLKGPNYVLLTLLRVTYSEKVFFLAQNTLGNGFFVQIFRIITASAFLNVLLHVIMLLMTDKYR